MTAVTEAPLWLTARWTLVASLLLYALPALGATPQRIAMVSPPAGFEDLAQPREMVVDVHYGGRQIGEVLASSSPGYLHFKDPEGLLSLLPKLTGASEVRAALAQPLPTNSEQACSQTRDQDCGIIRPDPLGIIFYEDQFRADLFIAPRFLPTAGTRTETYLDAPSESLSLTSTMGLAVSGSTNTPTAYNLQNRTILGMRNARVRSDSSYASALGLVVDDFVLEVDKPDLRYSAGLFWAPGAELVGNRRIMGLGIGTQFDTRVDRETLQGTPLVLFLAQQSRVEILLDGRLVGSGVYDAGNTILETASLPSGSYSVLLRIHEPGGTIREEWRFFIKNAQIPPVGQPLFSAYAGVLANTHRGKPISLSDTLFYQFGTARRFNQSMAADVSVVGTQEKAIVQAGGWLMTPLARARMAGLLSTAGDRGLLLQLASSGRGRLNVTFDLRRIWNKSGRPLVPLQAHVDTFGSAPPTSAQDSSGSYTQATGSLGYSVGSASVAVIGSLRQDSGAAADYSIGTDISWTVASLARWQLMFHADAQLTRTTKSSFVGARLFWKAGPVSMLSSGGRRSLSRRGGSDSKFRGVWSVVGQYSHHSDDRTQLALAGGIDRDLEITTAHGSGTAYTHYGNARADVVQTLEGKGGTQFSLMAQTAAAVTARGVAIGGRDLTESAVIVSMDGPVADASFDVLVDGLPRGRLVPGRPLAVFVQPYRRYKVRLRPLGSATLDYDSEAREVTVYPGSVEHIQWRSETLFAVFGQAVLPSGVPLTKAMIQSRRGVGQTDENGYFQIEVTENDSLAFSSPDGSSCAIRLKNLKPRENYVPIGKVTCQ